MPAIDELETLQQDWELWPNIIAHRPTLDDFQFLDNGLTNNNWLLKGDSQDYVIRMNAANPEALYLNRAAEWHIHQLASDMKLCPSFVFRHPENLYWIRPFQPGKTLARFFQSEISSDIETDNILKQAAKIYKRIHSIPISNNWPRIHFKDRTDHYWQQIIQNNTDLTTLKQALDDQFQVHSFSPVLCHMDGNLNNWILDTDKKLSLIDWEYTSVANPMWDLAVFIDSAQLTNTQEAVFLDAYGHVSKKMLEQGKQQMHYLSQLWYVVQKQTPATSLNTLLKTERFC